MWILRPTFDYVHHIFDTPFRKELSVGSQVWWYYTMPKRDKLFVLCSHGVFTIITLLERSPPMSILPGWISRGLAV